MLSPKSVAARFKQATESETLIRKAVQHARTLRLARGKDAVIKALKATKPLSKALANRKAQLEQEARRLTNDPDLDGKSDLWTDPLAEEIQTVQKTEQSLMNAYFEVLANTPREWRDDAKL